MKNVKFITALCFSIFFLSACAKENNLNNAQTNNQFSAIENENNQILESYQFDESDISKYSEILENYKNFINNYYNGEENADEYPWYKIAQTIKDYDIKTNQEHGYAFKKLNDSTPPILLLLTKYKNDYIINAIYSIVNGEAKILDAYWNRYSCFIDKENFVHTVASTGAFDNEFTKYKLNDEGNLDFVEKIEVDSYDENTSERKFDAQGNVITFYRYTNSQKEKKETCQQEFEILLQKIPRNNLDANLQFISLD